VTRGQCFCAVGEVELDQEWEAISQACHLGDAEAVREVKLLQEVATAVAGGLG
jgi:hypothetical protein